MPLAPQELRTYFITTVTASRKRLFQVERNALLLMEVLADQRGKGNIALHAFVIMPDHVHLLLTPAEMVSLEKAMQFVKGVFSFRLNSKMDVWERGFDSRRITTCENFTARVRYIHENPVRAFLAAEAAAYPFSSLQEGWVSDSMPGHFGRGARG